MDIGLNPENWGRTPAQGDNSRDDWQGLRARLLAGYAMRRAIGETNPRKLSGGSFSRKSARILGGYGSTPEAGLAPVNRSASDDGNSPGGKNEPVPGKKRPAIEE